MRAGRRGVDRRWRGLAPVWAGVLLVALALGASACGGDNDDQTPGGGKGTLIVRQVVTGGIVPIEGSIPFLRVLRDGEVVLRDRTPTTRLLVPKEEDPLLRQRLDAGEYTLISFQRTCAGNCRTLDAPSDRCEEEFELDADERLEAVVDVRPGEGCTIDASRGP